MTDSKLKVIELFSGIGAQVAALRRINIPYEVIGISEIDKYAIQSYKAINGPTFNYGDITKIPMLDYADLWTYSFPCQDLSVAGMQKGINEGTRSGLLLHVERLLELSVLLGNQPKYLLLENVKNLVGKKFKPDFDKWLNKLELLGYNNYWQVLNAKDYNIPQNRERVFVVSIRKDVDTKGYKFPEKVPLTRKLKDVLESEVNERYYLSQDKVDKLVLNMKVSENTGAVLSKYGANLNKTTDIASCLQARDYKGFGNQETTGIIEPLACASRGRNPDNPSDRTPGIPTEQRLEVNETGCSNTLTSVQKENYVIQSRIIQLGNIFETDRFGGNPNNGRVYSPDGCSPCLREAMGMGGGQIPMLSNNYRIRKLTPLECWRLMDFTDDEFYAAQFSGISNTQLYKQAGNSICVGVLAGIFKELLS